jgi:3-methylcrotonyl-CoA carboxylase alpha subunit
VRLADQAVCVGPAAARDSYLRIDAIIDAARRTGAQAVHPGYGFLSENPEFAQRCATAQLVFIGPPVSAMQAMSSKATAKQLMERSGVPLLPGYHGEAQDAKLLRREADRIGYPVLLKATAGGGGKGMRVIEGADQFDERLASCQREAQSSFGDARVLLEKFLPRPRHIEVQIFGDTHGQVVHLFERDCSSQRRHQKVLEEAPAPHFGAAERDALTQAACNAGRAVGYVGAGTCEFLFEPGQGFYFMEMNTRIQVEHPVTEMITGLDLVEWQLRVAAGEPLPLTQQRIFSRGHAIEVRLYAEIPEAGFLPSSGTLRRFDMPLPTAQVRIESGIQAGDTVGIDYDPMLAKLIVHADTREQAVVAMDRALAQVSIVGVGNNVMFLRRLVGHETFARGEVDIGFIERTPAVIHGIELSPDAQVQAAAALWTLAQEPRIAHSVWGRGDGWRLNSHLTRTVQFETGGAGETLPETLCSVVVEQVPGGTQLRVGQSADAVAGALRAEGRDQFYLQYGDAGVRLQITQEAGQLRVLRGPEEFRLRLRDPRQPQVDSYLADSSLAAPMPGRIVAHLVVAGTKVAKGAPLLIMEAMKMEHTICAPAAGTVRGYHAAVGQQVEEGSELIDFETRK